SPEVEGISGKYFVNGKPKASAKSTYERGITARLWQVSSDLVGLSASA
ncbi:MAG: short-chain dehydrogenase, partial [Chloroflexi bacterium]|nr:short-chain dehydrogenase [Chloroflexota bacterium]